jgi:hypothetical protein
MVSIWLTPVNGASIDPEKFAAVSRLREAVARS